MSRPRPSSSLGFYRDQSDLSLPHRDISSPLPPSHARRNPFTHLRRKSQMLTLSTLYSKGKSPSDDVEEFSGTIEDNRLSDYSSGPSGPSDIGDTPAPTKVAKYSGLGLRRPKALSAARLGGKGGAVSLDDNENGNPQSDRERPGLDAELARVTSHTRPGKIQLWRKPEAAPGPSASEDRASALEVPRTTSALDYYRHHGPTQGLASKIWPSRSPRLNSPRPSKEGNMNDEQSFIGMMPGRPDTARPRPRSRSLTMASLVRRPSTRGAHFSDVSTQHVDPTPNVFPDDVTRAHATESQGARQTDKSAFSRMTERIPRPPSSPSAKFQPQSLSRHAAKPFLNTFTARAYKRDGVPALPSDETRLRMTRKKRVPTSSQRHEEDDTTASPSVVAPDVVESVDVPPRKTTKVPENQIGLRGAMPYGMPDVYDSRQSSRLRSPSVSALDEMPYNLHAGEKWDPASQTLGATSLSRLASRLSPSIAAPKTKIPDEGSADMLGNDQDIDRPVAYTMEKQRKDKSRQLGKRMEHARGPIGAVSRPSSPFGFPANSSLQSLGHQLGDMSAAVGKRGWDFVRNWGATSVTQRGAGQDRTHSDYGLYTRGSDVATNAATATWLRVLQETEKNPQKSTYASSSPHSRQLFGAPLRTAVLETRLGRLAARSGAANEDTLPQIGNLSLGTSYSIALPDLNSQHTARERSRVPVSRGEARLKYLPGLVVRCIEAVERWGYDEEGIYRLSGRSSHTSRLQQVFDIPMRTQLRPDSQPATGDLDLAAISPADLDLNSVCSVLKSYLRSLPDTIIPRIATDSLSESLSRDCGIASAKFTADTCGISIIPDTKTRDASEVGIEDGKASEKELRKTLKSAIDVLPAANWYLLRELALHLYDMTRDAVVERTRMPLSNLCLVLAPTLSLSVPVVHAIVRHASDLFEGPGPSADEDLDMLDVTSSSDAPAYARKNKEATLSSSLLSFQRNSIDDSHRLSVATVTNEPKRQSDASMSTLQHEPTPRASAYSSSDNQSSLSSTHEAPLLPVAAKFMKSPSMASLHSPRLMLSDCDETSRSGPLGIGVTGSSSADSSLPSSYWTGVDRDSEASSALTEDSSTQGSPLLSSAPSFGLTSGASASSVTSAIFQSGERSDSAPSPSAGRSALDRPRPPTRGKNHRFITATRALRPSRSANADEYLSRVSSSKSGSSASSSSHTAQRRANDEANLASQERLSSNVLYTTQISSAGADSAAADKSRPSSRGFTTAESTPVLSTPSTFSPAVAHQ